MAFFKTPGIPPLYSGVTITNPSNGAIRAAQSRVCWLADGPNIGGTGSSRCGSG